MKLLVTLFLAGLGLAVAADAPGVKVYKVADIKAVEKKLEGKVGTARSASEQLDKFGNHFTSVAHRQTDGSAEVHEKQTDIFVVQTGEATLVVGGKLKDGKSTGPNEIRGSGIEGGEKHAVAPGDVIHIPNKVPHQLLVPNGKKFTYFVIKIDSVE